MKKLFFYLSVAMLAVAAVSCQKEMVVADGEEGNVTLTIQTPEVATKAIADGENVDIVYYEVYKKESIDGGAPLIDSWIEDFDGTATLKLNLLQNQNYVILFWAEVADKNFYDTDDLRKVTVDYTGLTANNEDRAAFCQVFELSTSQVTSATVTLVRPFAQINLGTTLQSIDPKINGYVLDLESSYMEVVGAATTFNVATMKTGSETTTAKFGDYTVPHDFDPQEVLTVNNVNYAYLGMNYILAANDKATVDVQYKVITNVGSLSRNIPAVPVQKNHRTNILGNLLTQETAIEIIVDEKFNQPDPDINVEVMDEIPAEIALGNGNAVLIPDLSGDQNVTVSGKGSIELQGTTITSTAANEPAITLEDGAEVTLIVTDNVTIEGATAGIVVPEGAVLKIVGSEEVVTKSGIAANNLTVVGKAGSGIDGSVTIENVAHLTAKGNGDHAYGIGGIGANVVIKNTTVDYACGGHIQPLCINDPKYGKSEPEGGAAIGGAYVKIEGSTVTKADGGSKAAAIGERYHKSTEIEIINSTIVEANGGNASAGIGGSRYSGDISADNKQVSKVKIENSTVTATGGQFGAGIGAGYDTHCAANETNAVNEIVIINSTVNAQGGMYAAGIGTGYHSAALTGSIDAASTVYAVSGEKYYKDEYTEAQNIGYGVVDLAREGKDLSVSFTVAGKKISAPAASYAVNENEVLIGSANGLKKLADAVNNGTDYYAGKTVKLTADIDLNDAEWTPIGSAYADHGFMGNFDGNGFTIKNLKMTQLPVDADGYVYAGLFGVTEGTDAQNQNSIKNLVIENVNIETEGNIAAAAIAYPYYTAIENVTVKGNVTIKGAHYTAGVLAYTRRCVDATNIVIAANKGSYIEGDQTVGGVISDIQTNGNLTANYSNFAASGLTIKATKHVGGISGIIARQTLNGATVKNVTIVSGSAKKGIVSGANGGNASVNNVEHENVVGATSIIGASYDSTEATTAEGLIAALANGGDVALAADVTINESIVIAKDGNVNLDLNGHVLAYAVNNDGKASAVIVNNGTLLIINNAQTEAKITFKAENPDMSTIPSYATNTITNEGTLTIGSNVIVENHSEGGASYAVDNKGVFTLNGGTLKGNRCALRIAKYNQDNVKFVMNGGLVTAIKPSWIQLPGSNFADAPTINVEINDGTFLSTAESSADNNILYTYSYGNSHKNTAITINGGNFLGGTVSIGSGANKQDTPTLNIKGGTFEYDVLQWVDEGSVVLHTANR